MKMPPMANVGIKISEEDLRALLQKITTSEALRPAKIVIDAPHAKWVEFGTDPCTNKSPAPKITRTVRGAGGKWFTVAKTETFWKLYDWTIAKVKDVQDPFAFTEWLYADTMEHGMPPRPYIRPIVHEAEGQFGKMLADKGSVYGVAEEIADRIIAFLNRPYDGARNATTYKGTLVNSIRVEYATDEDMKADVDVPPEVWESDTCDIHGVDRDRGGI